MKRIMTTVLFLLAVAGTTWAEDVPPKTFNQFDIQQELQRLSIEAEKQKQFKENLKREIQLDFRDLENENWTRFFTILGAILLIGIAFWGGWKGTKESILKRAEEKAGNAVQVELALKVKDLVDDMTEKKVEQFISRRADLLTVIFEDYERRRFLKDQASIAVLAESEEAGEDVVEYLREKRFQKVRVVVPKVMERVEADLVLFNREKKTADDNLEFITNDFLNEYIKRYWEGQKIVYFGPRNSGLDTRTVNLGFANYRQKLEPNLMEMLDAPGESDHLPA